MLKNPDILILDEATSALDTGAKTRAGRPQQPARGRTRWSSPTACRPSTTPTDRRRRPRPHRRTGHAQRADGTQRHLRQADRMQSFD
ncbi:MAG: hypothetical protein ACLRMJ_04245 [Alistipes finegoldii]